MINSENFLDKRNQDVARRRTFDEFTYSFGLIIVYKLKIFFLQFNNSQRMSEKPDPRNSFLLGLFLRD